MVAQRRDNPGICRFSQHHLLQAKRLRQVGDTLVRDEDRGSVQLRTRRRVEQIDKITQALA